MYFKSFEYGHSWEAVMEFIAWWMKSENFSKDMKEGDRVDGGFSVRDITHTIRLVQKGKFEIVVEKSAIFSDGTARQLAEGEIYLNKESFGRTGFTKQEKKIRRWLKKTSHTDPDAVDCEKAFAERLKFDMIGIGFTLETIDSNGWKLKVVARVVGLPK